MKKHTISILLIFLALFSCKNQNNDSKSKEITDFTQENSIKKEEIEETDFDNFFKIPSLCRCFSVATPTNTQYQNRR